MPSADECLVDYEAKKPPTLPSAPEPEAIQAKLDEDVETIAIKARFDPSEWSFEEIEDERDDKGIYGHYVAKRGEWQFRVFGKFQKDLPGVLYHYLYDPAGEIYMQDMKVEKRGDDIWVTGIEVCHFDDEERGRDFRGKKVQEKIL